MENKIQNTRFSQNTSGQSGISHVQNFFLHLQPRQMTLVITELRDSYLTGPETCFNPNIPNNQQQNHQEPVKSSRRLSENAPPIAQPLSSVRARSLELVANNRATCRLTTYSKRQSIGQSGLMKSYEDECDMVDNHNSHQEISRISLTSKQGSSYSSFDGHYSRSTSSNSSNQSRVAVSPFYCEGSVPTLQPPKNAVAPILIFDRAPSSGQTTLLSYSSSNDYTKNVLQVKNALISSDYSRPNSHVNPVPLNLSLNLEKLETKIIPNIVMKEKDKGKQREIKYIDEDTPTSSTVPNIEATIISIPRAATVI
jgi:tubby-related protein 4